MAVIHLELVILLAAASMLRAIDKVYPLAESFLRGITVYANAAENGKRQISDMIANRGKMTIEQARSRATQIVEGHKWRISPELPAQNGRGFENLATLMFSTVVTVGVTIVAGFVSCVRGTVQHEMSFIALVVCGSTAMYVLVVRATAVGGISSAAQRNQAFLCKLGVAAAAIGVVAALLAMNAPDTVFDFSLRRGLREAASKTSLFVSLLMDVPHRAPGTASDSEPWLGFTYLVVALLCGLVTFAQVMPAILYSRSLAMQLRDTATPQWKQLTLLGSFVLPLVLAALWVRPVLGNSLLPPDLIKCSADALARDCTATPHAGEFFLTETQWLSVRVGGALLLCAINAIVVRWHMEAHMRRARDDQVETLVEFVSVPESSINEDFDLATHLRGQAAEPYQNINVVASSLLAPFVVLAMLALIAIRKGQLETLHTCPALHMGMEAAGIPADLLAVPRNESAKLSELDHALHVALATAFPKLPDVQNVHLISPTLWRPVLSVLLWFFLVSWFILTGLGLSYWQLKLGSAKLRIEESAAPSVSPSSSAAMMGEKRGSKTKGKVARKPKPTKQS